MIEIYTDGACWPNPGFGGWGYVATRNNVILSSRSGFEPNTTNNRMEYVAAIEALKDFLYEQEVMIFSDSELLVKSVNDWMWRWAKQDFHRRIKKNKKIPVKNKDLVLELHRLQSEKRREFRWLKGHAGHIFNEMADQLANAAAIQCRRTHLNSSHQTDHYFMQE